LLEGHQNSQTHSQNKKSPLLINDPLRLGEKIQVKDVCPSCHSIYITKDHCEACGLQFGLDVIGEPFGAKSFFTLKDDFDLSLNKLDHVQWNLAPDVFLKRSEVKRYIRHMLKRFNDLSSYLFSLNLSQIPERNDEPTRLFIFEAKEIMKEYQKFSPDLSSLYVLLKKNGLASREVDPVGSSLVSYMHELNAEKTVSKSSQASYEGGFSYWEMLKRGIVLEALVAIGAVTLASFLVFKFLTT